MIKNEEKIQICLRVRKIWVDELNLVCDAIGVDKEDTIRLVVADWVNQRKLEFAEKGYYLEKK